MVTFFQKPLDAGVQRLCAIYRKNDIADIPCMKKRCHLFPACKNLFCRFNGQIVTTSAWIGTIKIKSPLHSL